jgi:branched-chain amino acid transport system substrate-binding protein
LTRAGVLAVACAFALALAACGGDDEAAEQTRNEGTTTEQGGNAPSGEPIKFGALAGVTGFYGPFTDAGLAASNVAIEEINAAGGILGRPVELVVADNKSSVEGSVSGFNKLVEVDGVQAIGMLDSDGAVATFDASLEQKIAMMCGACGTSDLDTKAGKYMWRLTASDSDLGPALAQSTLEDGIKKIALLVEQTEGPLSSALAFKEAYEAQGGEVCADVRFDAGKSSYASDVRKAWDCDPEAVHISAGIEASVPILREWDRRGYGGKILAGPDLGAPEVSGLTPALEDGNAILVQPSYDDTSVTYKSFAERYKEKTGREPSEAFVETYRYDEYILFALAATAANGVTGEAIASKMLEVTNPPGKVVTNYADGVEALKAGEDIDFTGASGSVDLNEYGNAKSPIFRRLTVVDGKWTPGRRITLKS